MHATRDHAAALRKALDAFEVHIPMLELWGEDLAELSARGNKVLVIGNGGSAAQAQHLSAELVGRYCFDRKPISAIALHADTSALTAIANDFGVEELFARQIKAHARPGDLVVALSTSGQSRNVIEAVSAAKALGIKTLALTGPGPNALLDVADEGIAVMADETATIQEVHLMAIHMMCAALDQALGISS